MNEMRKRTGAIILIVFIAVIVIWNVSQIAALTQLQVEYERFNIAGDFRHPLFIIPVGLTVTIALRIRNPSPIPIYVPDVDFDIFLGGKYLTTGHLSGGQTLNPGSSTVVSIPFYFKWTELASALITILQEYIRTGRVTVKVTGTAQVRVNAIPLLPFYYTLPVPFTIEGQAR